MIFFIKKPTIALKEPSQKEVLQERLELKVNVANTWIFEDWKSSHEDETYFGNNSVTI